MQEIAPLGENDLMYVADRHKACCDFPLHRHTPHRNDSPAVIHPRPSSRFPPEPALRQQSLSLTSTMPLRKVLLLAAPLSLLLEILYVSLFFLSNKKTDFFLICKN